MTTALVAKSYLRFLHIFKLPIKMGWKSVTRRPDTDFKPGDRLDAIVEGRRIGSLIVLRVKDELLQDMTREDAESEGFVGAEPLADFQHVWDRLCYPLTPKYRWELNPNVQVITFSFTPGGAF